MSLKQRQEVDEKYAEIHERNYGAYREGMTPTEVVDYYNNWKTYTHDTRGENYKGPYYGAHFVQKYCGATKQPKVLDIGAGTGTVGYELDKLGFTNLHALEPAEEFFINSPYKKYYKSSAFLFLGEQTKSQLCDDNFDAIVTVGTFGEGHIPCAPLCEMIRIVKPGGHIIIVMRKEYLDYVEEYINRLEPFMRELEEAGKWKMIERHAELKDFAYGKDGIAFVFKVIESGYASFVSKILKLQ